MQVAEEFEEEGEVDEVVVDRSWSSDVKVSPKSSEQETSHEMSSGTQPVQQSSDRESSTVDHGPWPVVVLLRWRMWPAVWHFFNSSFEDKLAEERYRAEFWSTRKVRVFGLLDGCF
jgi:hypothetical protein